MTAQEAVEQWKEEVHQHFQKMAEDEKYREEYEKNPTDFLSKKFVQFAQYHVMVALNHVADCARVKFVPHDGDGWSQKSFEREDITEFYEDETDDIEYAYHMMRNRNGFSMIIDKDSIRIPYPSILIM